MNIPEKAMRLLEGLPTEKADWYALEEENHPPFVCVELDKVRRWLGVVSVTGGIRPSGELLALVLGHEREGCLRIFTAYREQTQRTTEEATATLGALAAVARRAKSMRLLDWSIDDVQPEAAGRPKLLVELETGLDQRFRDAAAARGESLRTFTEEAIRDRLARIERPLRRAGSRGRAT